MIDRKLEGIIDKQEEHIVQEEGIAGLLNLEYGEIIDKCNKNLSNFLKMVESKERRKLIEETSELKYIAKDIYNELSKYKLG